MNAPKAAPEPPADFAARLQIAVDRAQARAKEERAAALKPGDKTPAAEALSLSRIETEAGISNGYLTKLLKRTRDNPSVESVDKLAVYLGVGIEWLATGRGEMVPARGPIVVYDDRYPNRAIAAAKARREGYSEAAVRFVEALVLQSEGDRPETEWAHEIHDAQQRIKKYGSASPTGPAPQPDADASSQPEPLGEAIARASSPGPQAKTPRAKKTH